MNDGLLEELKLNMLEAAHSATFGKVERTVQRNYVKSQRIHWNFLYVIF